MNLAPALHHPRVRRTRRLLPLAGVTIACSSSPAESAPERGRALFLGTSLSRSTLNAYACATCHDSEAAPGGDLLKPGAPLAGATLRRSFWGGHENDLLRSINACLTEFMVRRTPLEATDSEATALYEYLVSLEPGDPNPVPFTVVRSVSDLPRGDADSGGTLFLKACSECHGLPHSGEGRLSARFPILPEDSIAEHDDLSPRGQRLVFIEKIRHGAFRGLGGDMPPFSEEVLSNEDASDVLEALGMIGQ